MDNYIYYVTLFDYYGSLLTEKQRQYFEDYYFENLSLSEISENLGISRNAVNKQIHKTIEKLEYYEEKLELYQKSEKIKKWLGQSQIEPRIKEKIEKMI